MRLRLFPFVLVWLAMPSAAAQDPHAAKDPRSLTWIAEGVLALGGGGLTEEDIDWLASQGFGAIADLRAEHVDPEAYILASNMTFLSMPIDSASHVNETQLATFVAWVQAQTAAGRPVYVHCTNGWHRAAAFAVAWQLANEGEPYDEASRALASERPGVVMRAISALLDYEATLTGRPQLAVVLDAETTHPGLGGAMPARVLVHADGAPAANASVRVWSEESQLRIEGTSDAEGVFAFTYEAPEEAFMDHLYARASLEGFADGADNVDFIFDDKAMSRGALDVVAQETGEGLHVRVTSGGRDVPARVVVMAPGFTAFEATAVGEVTIPDAPRGVPLQVRAVSWGSAGGSASAQLAPPPPLVAPPVDAEPALATPDLPPTADLGPGGTVSGEAHALRYAGAAVVAALGLLAIYAVVASRRRDGVGDR